MLDIAYEKRGEDIHQSLTLSEQALELSKSSGNVPLTAKSMALIALFRMITGDFDLSIDLAHEALDLFEELGDEAGIADAKYTLAGAHYKRDDYYKGLNYLLECHSIYTEHSDHHHLSRVQKSMGTIYEYLGDVFNATKIYEEAVISGKKANDLALISNAYNPLSGIYLNQGKTDKALNLIEKSIQLKNECKDIRGLAFALYGRGKVYTITEAYEMAEKDFLDSIDIHERMDEKLGWAMSHHKLGALYLKMGELEQAKKTLLHALEYSNKNKIILIKFKSNLLLHEIAKREGQFELALNYLTQYLHEKEKAINTQTADAISGYTSISKMKELEMEAQAQKEKASIIEKKHIELDSFFYRISHDLKGPITSMMSLGYIVKHDIKEEKSLRYFEEYDRQTTRLNNILDELLRLTKLSFNVDTKQTINFDQIVEDCIGSYKYLENFSKISFATHIESFEYQADWSLINTIVQNLVENGIKYARIESNDPKIEVRVWKDENINIEVKDNGIGMSAETIDKVFSMFYRVDRTIEGTGLGLHILKRAVEKLNGKVKVESQLGEGSIFHIILPTN